MWARFVLLPLGFLVAITHAMENCSPKSCRNPGGKAVCGTDGLTYPSRCHLELTRCRNPNVTLSHRGVCKKLVSCFDYVKKHPQYKFRPRCKENGDFNANQCYPDIGFCWCVSSQGVPVPSTSVKYSSGAKNRCGKRKTTRRSSDRLNKKGNKGKNCKRQDKAIFNNNLIRIFHTEWSRDNHNHQTSGLEADRIVLNWKFDRMDTDRNGQLDKNEYRDLRRLLKKVVKPKKCARSFARSCDVNRDQVIGRLEWAECLMDDKGAINYEEEEDDEDYDGLDLFSSPRSPPHGVLSAETRPMNSGQNYEDDSSERRDEDPMDCFSDRQTAISEQKADKKYELYIPECTPDGRYQKVQCYKSAGYCWCVNEDTGKNIPGTSVKNQTPKCDHISTISRPMKGCPDDRKIPFLKEVIEFLHDKMVRETNGTNISSNNGPGWKASKEERVATWSFVIFDKNKNHMLEKTEWKAFKDQVATVKSLKKCGKKLPRYCDINKDRQISLTEWLDCLNTNRLTPEQVATTSATPGSTRSGNNPIMFLMED